jgi:tetratricopeptide (TPR) repeat protein
MAGNRPGSAATSTMQQALQHALASLERGDLGEVERACRGVLAARPDAFEALYLLGIAAGRQGRAQEAAELLGRAAAANPRHADAHFNHGVALGESGRFPEAVAAYARALALAPGNADAHYNQGVALDTLERGEEALAAYERAIALRPDYAQAHHNRGVALGRLGRAAESLAAFERAIALRPDYAAAHNHRGAALAALGRAEDALAAYDRAAQLAPDYPEAHNHRAIALHDLDRAGESLAAAERALALSPRFADAWYNRGNALRDLNRHADAAQSYERAIAIDPAHASAHWNLADCRLILGDFARGWDEYEWRWKLAARRGTRRDFAQPLWLADAPLAGRTILLHAELGLGDTLQFCRYATEVARRGATVVLEVQAPLVALLSGLEGVARVVARGEALPPFDFHCPLMSLPLAFRTDFASVPARVPYLRADPARVAAWRERLGAAGRPRVGFAWSGSSGLRNDRRSMTLAQMLPLVAGEIDWVSLQKEVAAADAPLLAARDAVRDAAPGLVDFAETAALVELLDLVITVDTSVAHVAGALAKPVWILLPHSPHDWRWLLGREDSPWYPQARLFRQRAPGDWAEVVERVARALAQWRPR